MKRQGITLTAGILAVGCLTGAYYMLKMSNEKTEEKAALGETIVDIDPDDITAISFETGEETAAFSLGEDGNWHLDGDENFPVDSAALLAPLNQAAPLKAVRKLTDAAELSEYGLDEPQNVVTLVDGEGKQTTLTVGAQNSSTGNDYLMLNEDSSVIYTVDAAFRDAFSDQLYDYAQSEELPMISAADVTEISVERREGGYRLYLEDAIWKTAETSSEEPEKSGEAPEEPEKSGETSEEPETSGETSAEPEKYGETSAEPEKSGEISAEAGELSETDTGSSADADAVNDMLTKLSRLAYNGYLDYDCKDASVYGLDSPAAVLTIIWKEEADKSAEETETEQEVTETAEAETLKKLVFRIGSTDENGNYYVQQPDSGEVHTMAADILNLLLNTQSADWISEEAKSAESEVS